MCEVWMGWVGCGGESTCLSELTIIRFIPPTHHVLICVARTSHRSDLV